jgi:ketosteroid isomerase-like protein
MVQDDGARGSIDAANRRFEAAFNAGAFAGATREVYTPEARVLPPDAPIVRGLAAIADFWTAAAAHLGVTSVQLATEELEVVGDVAHEIGKATLTLAGGHQAQAKYVVIWKRLDGQWRWDVDIWNSGV